MYLSPLRVVRSASKYVRHGSPPLRRAVSTLPDNPSIFLTTFPTFPGRQYLTLLPTALASPELALGFCPARRLEPQTFEENPKFLRHLQDCLRRHAYEDPYIASQAAAFASQGGAGLGMPGSGMGGGGASDQGGMGSAGNTGYIHVSDLRNPPPYGRIPDPQDIFGSLEVNGSGHFVNGHGNYEESGTYRLWTREGLLGLTNFLREKLVAELVRIQNGNSKSI